MQKRPWMNLDDIEFIFSHQIPIVTFHHRSPFFSKEITLDRTPHGDRCPSPRRHGTMAHGGAGADGG